MTFIDRVIFWRHMNKALWAVMTFVMVIETESVAGRWINFGIMVFVGLVFTATRRYWAKVERESPPKHRCPTCGGRGWVSADIQGTDA